MGGSGGDLGGVPGGFHPHLAKGALPDEGVDLVALQPALPAAHDVVVVVVVEALVEQPPLLLGAGVLGGNGLSAALLLGVVNLG